MARPTLSVAMIVKNEEHCVADAINSISAIADQIVVVDTGSTDRTVAIARSLGAEVYEHTWQDDFSIARNESLSHCRGDWIFVLDADEVVAQHDLSRLRALTETGDNVAYRFVTRNYGFNSELTGWVPFDPKDPCARGYPGWHPSIKPRLFRNHPEIRFEGRIHELVSKSLDRVGVPAVLCPVPVHHYGRVQMPDRFKSKQRHYVSLSRRKVLDNPHDAKSHFELGNQLHELGDYQGALDAYRQALELEPGSSLLLADMGAMYFKLGDFSAAKEVYQRAVELDPNCAENVKNLGVTLARLGEYSEAISRLEKAAKLQPDLFDVHRALGTVLEMIGRPQEAFVQYRLSLENDGPGTFALERFTKLAIELGELDGASSVLRDLRKRYPQSSAIANSLGEIAYRAGRVDEAADLFVEATRLDEHNAVAWNNLGVVYVSMNRLKDAVDCFKKCLEEDPSNTNAKANLIDLRKILSSS